MPYATLFRFPVTDVNDAPTDIGLSATSVAEKQPSGTTIGTLHTSDQDAGKGIFPAQAEIRSRIEAMARFYGLLAGVTYAEPFLQKEVGLVEDLTTLPVKSI